LVTRPSHLPQWQYFRGLLEPNLNPSFADTLITWYRRNKRDLPWRTTRDPYYIWLSEVILQQTQVAQGLDYYNRFIKAFPTVKDLASAPEDKVLREWQGLGYYSRARNLHFSAKQIAGPGKGVFPATYEHIRALKGVGDYTAAAIASFAFGLPHAVVDGNVYRVLSRVFGVDQAIDSTSGKKTFQALAGSLLDRHRPGEYNQAIMEFGSLHCRPRNPDCGTCPFAEICVAHRKKTVDKLPLKEKKTRSRDRHFNYLVIADSRGRLLLEKRGAGDIWEGLYQFKLIESPGPLNSRKVMHEARTLKLLDDQFDLRYVSEPYTHVLTHQKLLTRFFVVRKRGKFSGNLTSAPVTDLGKYPFPRLIGKFLAETDLQEML
jgi:A/G-specific adenine glycosylase